MEFLEEVVSQCCYSVPVGSKGLTLGSEVGKYGLGASQQKSIRHMLVEPGEDKVCHPNSDEGWL